MNADKIVVLCLDMRKPAAVFVPVMIGAIGFMNVARNPRFEAFHTVDVLQLIATGMCIGVALAAAVAMARGRSGIR